MLDIYLFEPDKAHVKKIREICAEYAIKHNADPELKTFEKIPERISCGGLYGSETSLYTPFLSHPPLYGSYPKNPE